MWAQIAHGVTWLAFAALVASVVSIRGALARSIPGARSTTTRLVGLILVIQVAALVILVPEAPWHSFHHGTERWAWLHDVPWTDDHGRSHPHGATWWVWMRAVWGLTSWWATPFGVNAAMSVGSTALLFAFVRRIDGDAVAVVAAAIHAFLPVVLRTGPTVSIYVGVEFSMLLVAFLTALHLEAPSVRTFGAALAAMVLSMNTHLEMMPVTLVVVLALIATMRPTWFRDFGLKPTSLAMAGLAVAAMLPHVVAIVTSPEGVLPSAPIPPSGVVGAVRTRLLWMLVLWVVLAWVPPPAIPERLAWIRDNGPRAIAAFVWAVVVTELLRSGVGPDLGEPGRSWSELHALLSRPHTPLAWTVLAVVGLFASWLYKPRMARVVVPILLVTAWFHAGHHDVLSTYVRMSLVAAPWFAWLAGHGLVFGYRIVGEQVALKHIGYFVAVAGLLSWPYRPWILHIYPSQAEFKLLLSAREDGGMVVLPTGEDHPDDVDPAPLHLDKYRGYAAGMVGDPARVRGLKQALASPDEVVGASYVRTLSCVTPLRPASRDGDILYAAGRVWDWRPEIADASHPGAPFLASLSPCWHTPDRAVCAEQGEGSCARWTCPDGPSDEAVPAYLDPVCAAFEEAFELEPLERSVLTGRPLSDERLQEGTVLGRYRVVGLRSKR